MLARHNLSCGFGLVRKPAKSPKACKFGQAKTGYGLNRIKAYLKDTFGLLHHKWRRPDEWRPKLWKTHKKNV